MSEETIAKEAEDNTEAPEEKETLAETMYGKEDEGQVPEPNEEEAGAEEEKVDEAKSEESKEESVYEDFTLPEGFDGVSDEAIELFKDSKLSQEDAQKFVDYGAKIQQDTLEALKNANEAQQKEWAETVDKELKAELPKAVDFVKKHSSEGFIDFLNESGLGNHPEMVKMMAKLADFSGEDLIPTEKSSLPSDAPKTLADSLYGDKYK